MSNDGNYVTIQRTSKKWKSQKALSSLLLIGVLVWYFKFSPADDAAAHITALVIVGTIVWKIYIRVGRWWENE